MNSSAATDAPRALTARGRRQARARKVRRFGPLVVWGGAVVAALVLGESAFEGPKAPGAAEEVLVSVSASRPAFVREVNVDLGDRV